MPKVEVCLSPELIHLFDLKGKIVVMVDILRASSSMTTGLAHGVTEIKPVAQLEECSALKEQGYFTAGERNGQKVDGFDIGNSPFSYMKEKFKGGKIATTTTNGTLAITKSTNADQILVGSFLNLTSVANYLKEQGKDIVIHCAGWKGNYSLEDTLFAGALFEVLQDSFDSDNDAAHSALTIYKAAKERLYETILESSHAKRLEKHNIIKDLEFCSKIDVYDIVPILKNGSLIVA